VVSSLGTNLVTRTGATLGLNVTSKLAFKLAATVGLNL
jgi:hypothetical protein